jgi:hypothetical protein
MLQCSGNTTPPLPPATHIYWTCNVTTVDQPFLTPWALANPCHRFSTTCANPRSHLAPTWGADPRPSWGSLPHAHPSGQPMSVQEVAYQVPIQGDSRETCPRSLPRLHRSWPTTLFFNIIKMFHCKDLNTYKLFYSTKSPWNMVGTLANTYIKSTMSAHTLELVVMIYVPGMYDWRLALQ